MFDVPTPSVILEYQARVADRRTTTIADFKETGRELRDRFGLTDREAIDLLNNSNVLETLVYWERTSDLRKELIVLADYLTDPDARQEQHEHAQQRAETIRKTLREGAGM